MSVKLGNGSAASGELVINTDGAALVTTNADSRKSGPVPIAGRADPGAFTGVNYDVDLEVDDDFRARVAQDAILYQESWAGAALNSAKWTSVVTTATTAVAGAYLSLNSAPSAAANAVARVTSYATFPMAPGFHLQVDIPFQIAAASVGIPNTTIEMGLFIASGTTAPTDGVFVRINASGQMFLVANFNGAETQSTQIDFTDTPTGWTSPLIDVNVDRQMMLVIASNHVDLWINDVLVASLDQPVGQPTFCQAQQLPLSFRIYNAASVPASGTILKIGPCTISMGGMGNAVSYNDALAISEAGAYQGQSGGTMGQTSNNANSSAPATASLSNTAAGYTTLGGRFSFAAPAGAETDYALFAYLVPAAAANAHNRGLLIRGVRIDAVNIGAAVATTATVLEWSVAVGSSAVSLATTDAATTKAPRRHACGVQSWIVGAAIGAPVESIKIDFGEALYCAPGQYVHVIVRAPVGTATASQVIRGLVGFVGVHV